MVYLDYNATSPLLPAVHAEMTACLNDIFGNASSVHMHGRRAREAGERVRALCLASLGDPGGQLIFTSGGTEADNLALRGVMEGFRHKGNHLIVSAVEHQAVLHTAEALATEGMQVTILPVDSRGVVDLEALRRALTPRTVLISVMYANNEVGTIQPIREVGEMARTEGILFHTDAVQSFGKLPLNVREIGADLVSISGHKIGAAKGIGALYVRPGVKIQPILYGGPHERGLRAGTENVAGIVGFGVALETVLKEQDKEKLHSLKELRDRLEAGLHRQIPDLQINGDPTRRLDNTSNMSFIGCRGETLLMALDMAGICVSTGSACSSGSTEPSHVLVAMRLPPDRIESSIRFSLGWGTTEAEIEEVVQKVPPIVEKVRKARA